MSIQPLLSVPYTNHQLSIVLICSLLIGIFLGAMAVGVFKSNDKKKVNF